MSKPLEPPMILGVRRSAILEVVLYLTAALVLDQFLFEGNRYRSVSPHPFWPIVLLTAVQYGTTEAVVAAVLASVALLAGHIPEQSISQDQYEYVLMLVREPVMWFVAAIAFGELRMRHIRERSALQLDLGGALKREQDVSEGYSRLTVVKDNLETRIAGQLRSAITMYQAARSLEKMDPSEVLLNVMDVVRIIMNPEKFSLYLLENDVLEVCTGEGWTSDESLSRIFRPDSRLFHEVIARQRVVCGANEEDERILAGEGILAGPLMDRETGQVIGMLKVERIGFFELHFSNVQTFGVLCDWIADAYVNARRFQTAESDSFVDPATGLLSYSLFERQTTYVRALGEGLGFSLSTLLVSVDNEDALTVEDRARMPRAAAAAIRHALRQTDQVFDGSGSGHFCCILMPGTSREEAARVGDRILFDLSQIDGDAKFSYVIQHLDPSPLGRNDPTRLGPSVDDVHYATA
jgi:hypothetical protein